MNDLPSVGTEDYTEGRMTWHRRKDGSLIYVIGNVTFGPHAQGDIYINEADLRRIAACWNALEGVPTEEIETVLIHGKALKDVVSERDHLDAMNANLRDQNTSLDAECARLEKGRDELASRVRELEGERDRALRNRDMWKGQCERQAEQLTALRVHPHASEAITWTPETGYVYSDAALNSQEKP